MKRKDDSIRKEALKKVSEIFPETAGEMKDEIWLLKRGFFQVQTAPDIWENTKEFEPELNEETGTTVTVTVERKLDRKGLHWKAIMVIADDDGVTDAEGLLSDTPEEALVSMYEKMIKERKNE